MINKEKQTVHLKTGIFFNRVPIGWGELPGLGEKKEYHI